MRLKNLVLFMVCLTILPATYAGNIAYTVNQNHDWWWQAPQNPSIEVVAHNNGKSLENGNITLAITTDKKMPVSSFTQSTAVAAGDSAVVTFNFNVTPGFYKCTLTDNLSQKEIQSFNIGYEPENIVSLPDAQPDFHQFWADAKAELANVAPEYSMTEEKDKSNKVRKVFLVKMKSLGDEEIQGYLTIPVKKGKHPVILYYMGYGSKPWYPHPDSNPEFIEFVLSTRGQGLCEPQNKYGDWIVSNLNDKNNYYYRGAFMDLVRAIDFVYQLPQADNKNIFAEGGSQGGAFTLAACALDNRITAAAPYIPFLSDYHDYFQIVHWPAQPVLNKQKELGMDDKSLYTVLSYFDIKNFARDIKCPIFMGAGLQDPVCPPHTNFSSYNLITSPKQFTLYRECGHDVRHPDWEQKRMEFFMKNKK